MSTGPTVPRGLRERLRGRAELGVCAALLALGVLVLTDALTMDTDFAQRGPVGPTTVPLVVGGLLVVVAVVLAVDVLRGTGAGADGGEGADGGKGPGAADEVKGDEGHKGAGGGAGESVVGGGDEGPVTGTGGAGWRTVVLLAGVFLAHAALIGPLGFPLAGALLFWGAAYALGSRNPARDPLIAAVLAVATHLVFTHLLGVPLPGGPLMEVL